MENQKRNTGLYVIVSILCVLVLLLGGYIVYDKVLSNKETPTENNVTNNDNTTNNTTTDNDSQKQLSVDEQKGLDLYKLFVGNGTGPFKWENNAVVNYDDIISRMTDSYKKSFENSDNGFSIPYNDNGTWKSFGGWGTDRESKYKDIKTTLIDSCKIHYEITYTYTKMGDTTSTQYEDTNEFVVKMGPCYQNDPDNDFSNGYKVDSFKLVFGLKFE